jgi:hypothetical protein
VGNHQLVRVRVLREPVEVLLDLRWSAGDRVRHHLLQLPTLGRGQERVRLLVREVPIATEEERDAAPTDRLEPGLRLGLGLGDKDVDPGDDVRPLQLFGGPELLAVDRNGLQQ